jgi:hypothetical protein
MPDKEKRNVPWRGQPRKIKHDMDSECMKEGKSMIKVGVTRKINTACTAHE